MVFWDEKINNQFNVSLSVGTMCACFDWLAKAAFSSKGGKVLWACLNGGWRTLWSKGWPDPKGQGHTGHRPACRPTFLKGVNLSETVSVCLLVTLSVAEHPWIVNLCHSLFVSVLSRFLGTQVSLSCFDGTVCLYLSTSVATMAAVKYNRTEVTRTRCVSSLLLWLCPAAVLFFIMALDDWSLFLPQCFISPL